MLLAAQVPEEFMRQIVEAAKVMSARLGVVVTKSDITRMAVAQFIAGLDAGATSRDETTDDKAD
jgi:hypothetical protein